MKKISKSKKVNKRLDFEDVEISEVVKNDYLSYATSSFIRMIPSAIDGLKPSQRRILYTMYKIKADELTKSADIVGQSMQLIPHGDQAIYGTLIVMAQPDRVRNTLVIGQGNLGTVTDSLAEYAASRYTEVKMSNFLLDFYFPEDFDSIDTMMTYKGIPTIREPVFLPTLLPMVLVQGCNGITPGFSSRIIPHNLHTVADAYIDYIKNRNNVKNWPKMTERILNTIKIDFPAPCVIKKDSLKGLETGRGQIIVQGKCRTLDSSRGKKILQVYQLPYLVEAPAFVEVCDSVFRKHDMLHGITDESGKNGILINIILKKDVPIKKALDILSRLTPFTSSYNYSMILNKDNAPKRMGVLDIFECHYQNKNRILNLHFTEKKQTLEERKICLDGAIFILGNPERRAEFIKMIETSTRSTILKNIRRQWDLDGVVGDYLINKKFSSLLNGVEALISEHKKVVQEYNQILKILDDLDSYLIKQIKEKISKYK